LEAMMSSEASGPNDDSSLVSWIVDMAEDSKTQHFTMAHAERCPQLLSPEVYIRWANDAAFTAKMARQYVEGPVDINRAEFWHDVYRFLMGKAGRPVD
jgi:hypothetical protein